MTNPRELVEQLLDGWHETIEYAIIAHSHTPRCVTESLALTIPQLRHRECRCPLRRELRVERRRQGPLITQLTEASYLKPVTGDDSRGAHHGPRAPGNLANPDEMLSELWRAVSSYWDTLEPGDSDMLRRMASDPHDANARDHLRPHVRRMRMYLGYDSPMDTFADTLCGECGGALTLQRDRPDEVRCAGTPSSSPCGTAYPWWLWPQMAPELVDTETACHLAGVPRGTLYSWASRGLVKRHGGTGHRAARWDASEMKTRGQ